MKHSKLSLKKHNLIVSSLSTISLQGWQGMGEHFKQCHKDEIHEIQIARKNTEQKSWI